MTTALVILTALVAGALAAWRWFRPRPPDVRVVTDAARETERREVAAAEARREADVKRGAIDLANDKRFGPE